MNLENLKQKRKELDLSQMDVAARVGVSLTSYRLWERGISVPNEENLEKLKKVLGEK